MSFWKRVKQRKFSLLAKFAIAATMFAAGIALTLFTGPLGLILCGVSVAGFVASVMRESNNNLIPPENESSKVHPVSPVIPKPNSAASFLPSNKKSFNADPQMVEDHEAVARVIKQSQPASNNAKNFSQSSSKSLWSSFRNFFGSAPVVPETLAAINKDEQTNHSTRVGNST